MAIKDDGSISITDISNEFTGSAPHALNEYYRGGAYVHDNTAIVPDHNSTIPTSGEISVGDFYGATNLFYLQISEDVKNYDVLAAAEARGWNEISEIVLLVDKGIYVWSDDTAKPALLIPNIGQTVTIENSGYIMGKGGKGGVYYAEINPSVSIGEAGGVAIAVKDATVIINNSGNGFIGGGGGGGGGGVQAGGGGGAGGGVGGVGLSGSGAGGAGGTIGEKGSNSALNNGNTGGIGGNAGGSGGGVQENKGTDTRGSGGGGGRRMASTAGASARIPSGEKEDWPGGYGGGQNSPGGAYGYYLWQTGGSTTTGGSGRFDHAGGGGGGWGAPGGAGYSAGGAGGRAVSLVFGSNVTVNNDPNGRIYGAYLR
tara:strand:- start:2088 stop:3197 length:1110 start_codon:yes stop_codon:yes gene_type:complete